MRYLRGIGCRKDDSVGGRSVRRRAGDRRRGGEAWARESLFRRYRQMAYGMALRLTGPSLAVDDIVQESFVRALRSLDNLKDPQSFARWLGTIIVHTASKMRRHERVLQRFGFARTEPIDTEAFIAKTAPPDVSAELRAIYALLNVLPIEAHIALVLRRSRGSSSKRLPNKWACPSPRSSADLGWRGAFGEGFERRAGGWPMKLSRFIVVPPVTEARIAREWEAIERRARPVRHRVAIMWAMISLPVALASLWIIFLTCDARPLRFSMARCSGATAAVSMSISPTARTSR